MVKFPTIQQFFLTIVMAWAGLTLVARAAEVEARLDREAVPAGEGAILTINVAGGRAGDPQIPAVDRLIVQPRNQSQQFRMVNGRTTISVVYNYVVGSNTPGDYVIPAIKVTVDGKEYTTDPLRLKVLEASAAQPPPGTPPAATGRAGEPADDDGRRFGFLTVELLPSSERKHVYVGEIAPVRIRAWIPANSPAQVRSTVKPEGRAFTLHNLTEEPQQTRGSRDGKDYVVVTWFGGISATKPGTYPASLSLDATVAVRDPSAPRRRRARGGPFDDPFFDSVFDRMHTPMIQKDVTLKSVDQPVEVRPLPEEGRPPGFAGAVGRFEFGPWQMPQSWRTGEPQQIRADVSGSGNFALLDAPQLAPADGWKTYPARDEFAPGDQASFSGTKSFRFSAVPTQGGSREQSLKLSFFDPESAEYRTLETLPQQVEIVGEDIVAAAPAELPAAPEPAARPADGLVGQRPDRGPAAALVPLSGRPLFGQLLGVAGAMFLAGPVLAAFRRRRADPQRRAAAAAESAVRRALAEARTAAEAGKAQEFFAAGRLALQERLAARWNRPPRSITTADLLAHLPADAPAVRFFREADAADYQPQAAGMALPAGRALLDEALTELDPDPAR